VDELIGTALGPYTVTERIGEGGMAVVYKGYQESLNRYVALKVLRDELARDQQFVARFRQEALAAGNLNHPNILHVYDAGAANGKYYIAMAYIDGGTLKDLVLQGAMEPERAVSITIQLAEALDHAHNHGLIHRDVKPSNVLMTRDGHPLLTDFGIAKALYEAKQLTRTGASIGTPEYMAPEQAQGQPPDGRTDVYALGVVLYEMLASKVPFCTDTPVATMYMHVHEPPPPLPRVDGAIPEWLENVVCKALAKAPADRYQTASLFAAALRQGQDTLLAPIRPVTPVAAAAAGVAAAAGAAGAAMTPAETEAVAAAGVAGVAAATGAAAAVAGTPAETEAVAATGAAAATGAVAEKKRRKALIPILVAAIALLVIATSVSAVLLFQGDRDGEPTATLTPIVVTRVVVPEDRPAEEMDDGGGKPTATSTATEEITATPTFTLTPSRTPSGTTTSTPSPSATPSRTPTRTPTSTRAATSTPTSVPTDTPVTPTNTPERPTPTDTPRPTNTPRPTDTPRPTKPPSPTPTSPTAPPP
jgi:serine/threonine-protein kinase